MAYVFANDIGGFQGARERELNRFDVLARQAAADQERAIGAANEADRFAYQAAARDAQLMEDRNRFQLQQALQERDREERRGDVLFNRRLMLGQEGREQARLNLAERRFKADEDAFKKQLELDSQLEGQEGEALAQRYMEIVPQLKSIDEQMEGLRDTDELRRKEAVELGLIVGPKGFDVPPAMVDIAKQQALRAKASEFNNELKRIAELQKAAKDKQTLLLRDKYNLDRSAGRMGAVLTERGLEGRGRIIPFPQVPASAVGGGLPVTVINRVDGGELGPVPGATPRSATPRSATPPPVARQTDEEFGPPAPVSPIVARQSATQVTPAAAAAERPRQYTGFVPAAYRAAGAGLKGAANYGIVLPIRTAVQSLPRMSGALIDAARATGDFLVMPPEGSDEYLIMMARRALEDRNRQRITQAFDEFAPRYMR